MKKTGVYAKRGDKNVFIQHGHAWKTGTRIHCCGYKMVWDSERGTYVLEHRLIYERHYKCCLLRWISVHHVDGNRLNNEISNLHPMTISAHSKLESIKGGDHYFKNGSIPWNKGKTLSQEIKQKIGTANRGRPNKFKGVPRSKETKNRVSAALVAAWQRRKKAIEVSV